MLKTIKIIEINLFRIKKDFLDLSFLYYLQEFIFNIKFKLLFILMYFGFNVHNNN